MHYHLLLLLLGALGVSFLACSDDDGAPPVPDCGVELDHDRDGYGPGCTAGDDCDDDAPGIVGPCAVDGCPSGWVLIPAGDFEMGCNSGDYPPWDCLPESPRHVVTLSDYCIALDEATVAEYRACVESGRCSLPEAVPGAEEWEEPCNYTLDPGPYEAHPMNCISRDEARAFCGAFFGGDLPTEAQWEKAARGTDGRRYTWGDTPEPACDWVNKDPNGATNPDTLEGYGTGCHLVDDDRGHATWPVGSGDRAGDSPYGIRDILGNVAEWVQDCYEYGFYASCAEGCVDPIRTCDASAFQVVTRGGDAWSRTWTNAVSRHTTNARTNNSSTGFRCTRPVPTRY